MVLACVIFTQYRSVMDGQTDAQMMAKMCEALHAVAHKKNAPPGVVVTPIHLMTDPCEADDSALLKAAGCGKNIPFTSSSW